MDSSAWDRRYASADLVWSAEPNAVVESHTRDLSPGVAVDLASGEGRNALWLASCGWRVTAVDFSSVATERARRLGAERLGRNAGLLTAVTADLLVWRPEPGSADLVLLAYLQLPASERRQVHRLAADTLRAGGTFLLIAHHLDNLEHGVGGPQDASVLFTQRDVLADLAGTGLMVDRAERVERQVLAEGPGRHGADDGGGVALDVLVRARRPPR